MALLDIRGIAETPTAWSTALSGSLQINRYCPVTEAVLNGFIRHGRIMEPTDGDPPFSNRQTELLQHLNVYMSAGREENALGMRTPLVFWLVICGWATPQKVLSAMSSENAGAVRLEDLSRLFADRWILEAMVENWPVDQIFPDRISQREYQLSAARPGGKGDRKLMKAGNGAGYSNNRDQFTVDDFTAAATDWNQRQGHLREEQCAQLTNEPALPALLSRPQIMRMGLGGGFEGAPERKITEQRWTDLVKHTFRALVDRHAGPVTARQVFEGISKGLDWFRQEEKR